ncbi:Bug family tripartite tricarboxylate transporter substrate binding protein [Paracandidimonas soli]|uniref:Tripartite-type tricarboxylate transporter receptor subunit TctC n=1 Tax=Paracandidimonas soli TaxID=1917182 RepID=A0A4R3V789_9BURK|nr:tripartite tricarboxylate transporter substrate binding protein [Paracandidimonas soli]TCU99228.1 tripartite-type tricarboxylate transporter receptor subunit TctC [Paracandidimonas soli]
MQTKKRHLIKTVLCAVAACGAAAPAMADTYPSKSVRMIIPFPPGGTLDVVGRMLAQQLGEQMGQSFVVENRPGGNGTIGAAAVARSEADGYTLLFNASTFISAPMTMKSVLYDTDRDFTPVASVAKAPMSVSINKDLPISDVKSLVAYAKANPGKMTFAVGSIGSAGHLATELLRRSGNLDFMIVPYRGTAPALQDLIGGRIDGFIDPILGSLSYHQSGMLKVVAVTSEERAGNLPDVATVGETIPGYAFYSWYGLWGPKSLPDDIAARLNGEVGKALEVMGPALKEQGLLSSPGSIEEFRQFQKQEMDRMKKIITEGNIRAE